MTCHCHLPFYFPKSVFLFAKA